MIACNTATAAAIDILRVNHPKQKFIGLEPMVKPAPSMSKTGMIAICATPTTLTANGTYEQKNYTRVTLLFLSDQKCKQ